MIPRKKLTARRPATGSRTKGKWIPGTMGSTFIVKASVQNPTPSDLQVLEEGNRTRKTYKLVSKAELIVKGENNDGDQVQIYDEWYETVSRDIWQNGLKNHLNYLVQRVTIK